MSRHRALLGLGLATLVASCGNGDRPSPELAERYDAVIAFCEQRLESTEDVCDRMRETDGATIVGHVLLGQAGGHELTVELVVTSGGETTTEIAPPDAIPADRSWLHGVEIERDVACVSLPCDIELRAIVDGMLVLTDRFTFRASE
ncbi:MAG: hypothetical protein R2707_14565 [Acidimicrobiales bacterium]